MALPDEVLQVDPTPYATIEDVIDTEYMEMVPKEQYIKKSNNIDGDQRESYAKYEEPDKVIPSKTPVYVNIPTEITSNKEDNEDAYEEMVEFMKKTFNPKQMETMVTMLQSVKQSMHAEEESQESQASTIPSSVPLADPMLDEKKQPYTDAFTPPISKDKSFFNTKEKIQELGMLLIDSTECGNAV